jgi:hypothetical protein
VRSSWAPADLLIRRTLEQEWRGAPSEHVGALRVLYNAANPDPHVAALEAAGHAQHMLPHGLHERLYTQAIHAITVAGS